MSREIKFRVWDIFKKVFIPEPVYALLFNQQRGFGVMLKDWENYREGEYFYSYSQTPSQYTGLKDKNGKEIYEGDILKGGRSKHGAVKFENGCFIVWDEPIGWDFDTFDEKPGIANTENWAVVIGNVYENPELLT